MGVGSGGRRRDRASSYRLVRYPERLWGQPTAEVAWSTDGEDPERAVDEVIEQVRRWGVSTVDWWIGEAAPRTERAIRDRGATCAETVEVLARALDDGSAGEPVTPGVVAVIVDDAPTLRAATAVRVAGWDQPAPDDTQFVADLERTPARARARDGVPSGRSRRRGLGRHGHAIEAA